MTDGYAIRAVISDFGGVLTTPLMESFAAYQRRSGITPKQLGEAMIRILEATGTHPLHELERGAITEDEFLRRLEQELGGDVRLREFQETYFNALSPNDEMIELMRELRERRYRMALLTNNVREWEPRWRAMLPDIDEIFEVVVDSAFVGMRKPEPEIYELTVERLGDSLRPDRVRLRRRHRGELPGGTRGGDARRALPRLGAGDGRGQGGAR